MLRKAKIAFLMILALISCNVVYAVSVSPFSKAYCSEDYKISDFDLDFFVRNSAMVFSGKVTLTQIDNMIETNANYKAFRSLLQTNTHKYITVIQDFLPTNDYFQGYWIILSNDSLYWNTSTAMAQQQNIYCNSNMTALYIRETLSPSLSKDVKSLGVSYPEYQNTQKSIIQNYYTVPYPKFYYYFSTCGITYSSNYYNYKDYFSYMPYQEIYVSLPIVSLKFNTQSTFVANKYLYSGKTTQLKILNNDVVSTNIIPYSSLAPNVPVAKLFVGTKELTNCKIAIATKQSSGNYNFNSPYTLPVLSYGDSIDYAQGGLFPVFGNDEELDYYSVYIPESFIVNDSFIYFNAGNNQAYESVLFYVGDVNYFNDDNLENGLPGESSGDNLSGIQNGIDNINNSLNEGFNNVTDKLEEVKTGIIDGLLNGIKSLFVPSNEEMSEWLSRTEEEVTEKMGILGEPVNFFSRLMNKLVVGTSGDFIIEIPTLSVPARK